MVSPGRPVTRRPSLATVSWPVGVTAKNGTSACAPSRKADESASLASICAPAANWRSSSAKVIETRPTVSPRTVDVAWGLLAG